MKKGLWLLFFFWIGNTFHSNAQNVLADVTANSNTLPFRTSFDQIVQLGEELRQPQLPVDKQKMIDKFNKINQQLQDSIGLYIQQHPNDNIGSILVLHYYFDARKDVSFLRKSFQLLQTTSVKDAYKTYIGEELNGIDSAVIGKKIPSFSLIDMAGKSVQIRNTQKTLLVFWASWCAPCRLESDHLKAQYAAIKNKGMDIVSIDLDDDISSWKYASKQDQLPWLNYYAGNGFESRIARFFTIHQIPQNVLLDSDGTIIAKNIGIGQLLK